MPIKLIVADDHAVVLEVVKDQFDQHDDIAVIGTAVDSTRVVELLSGQSCDVLITDYEMPGGEYGDGLPYLVFLTDHFPHLKVIVFTSADIRNIKNAVAKNDQFSFLQKSVDLEKLVPTVRRVSRDRSLY
jgi:two-component system capsular synthesis response regulator RcsB